MDGDSAFALVRAYAAIGDHRTATPVDAATRDWLAAELIARGGQVNLQRWSLSKYSADVSVEVDDEVVPAEALHYSGVDALGVKRPLVGEIQAHLSEVGLSSSIQQQLDLARRCGSDGLVLATRCPTDGLCAINRAATQAIDLPVILVPGNLHSRLRDAALAVEFNASVASDVSSNIIARFSGPPERSPIVVTTPMSGWFACAGERGCGLAVALHLVTVLRAVAPVIFVAPSGHELGYAGAVHLVSEFRDQIAGVIHIGSCLANIDGALDGRFRGTADVLTGLRATLASIDVALQAVERPFDPACWIGESECWAPRDVPMISIAGDGPLFHTPADLPDAATSPALLQRTLDAVAIACLHFVEGHRVV